MKVIADSSSTRTQWALIDENLNPIETATTAGLNPYFQTRREISHSIRLELPESFFKRRWEHVYFYGAGCANPEKIKIMEQSLIAQFKTPVTVESNLLGAARGLLVDSPGMACILGTGSNSCMYDGNEITKHIRPLGYILGDEGSGSFLGKRFVADCLKEIAPEGLRRAFYEHYQLSVDEIMDAVYTNSLPNRTLSEYSFFLSNFMENEYVIRLVYDGFTQFFTRNIAAYRYSGDNLCFVGSIACTYESILHRVARDFGLTINKVVPSSMPGLIQYHTLH
ncbi:MAG: hypothetical protein J1E84_07030 [Muribaculaceae bacterium]|nr:hypothetical protein [Muribaculaceae bacterium]